MQVKDPLFIANQNVIYKGKVCSVYVIASEDDTFAGMAMLSGYDNTTNLSARYYPLDDMTPLYDAKMPSGAVLQKVTLSEIKQKLGNEYTLSRSMRVCMFGQRECK